MSQNQNSDPLPKTRKFWVLTIAIGVIVMLGAAYALTSRAAVPADLGSKLQFVGKQNYGCPFLCDSQPGATYYFATNMTPTELEKYFTRANCALQGEMQLDGDSYVGGGLDCTSPNKQDSFYPEYYNYADGNYTKSDRVIEMFHLKDQNKHLVVKIDKADYKLVRNAL